MPVDEPGEDQDIAWLLLNQSNLDRRLSRVEDSLIFRTLRAIGRPFRSQAGKSTYAEWRKQGGGTLPPPPFSERAAQFEAVPATNFAEAVARSHADYLVLTANNGRVHPDAFAHFAAALPADLVYSDEEVLNGAGVPIRPVFKPDWSPVLLRSVNYLGGLVAIRRQLLIGFPDLLTAVRAVPQPMVTHIPAILHGAREFILLPAPVTPVPSATRELITVIVCTRNARLLETCLQGIRTKTDYPNLELLVVQHLGSSPPAEEAAVERVILTHGAKRIPYAAAFNFASMNNLGAASATGSILVFLNDDVYPLEPSWLSRLASWLSEPSVGAAGARLTYPDGTLQHAGIAAFLIDGAWHPGRRVPASSNWPWNAYTREVSAVTGACLAIRAADFRRLSGFDAAFPVNFNDVDLCFRLQEQGLAVIFDSEAKLRHDESRTRSAGTSYGERRLFFRKWAGRLLRPDPFYTPHLTQNNEELTLRR